MGPRRRRADDRAGRACDPNFYNEWRTASGARLLPAKLGPRRIFTAKPARLDLAKTNHPALADLADPQHSDLATALFQACTDLEPYDDTDVSVGAS